MENKKEERTEYVGLYMTPSMAKLAKEADNNERLKDRLIKDFVTNETDWIKEEIKTIDETALIYRAKLLTLRDNFAKAQDIYVEEIEEMCAKSSDALKPLGKIFSTLEKRVEKVKDQISAASKSISDLSSKVSYIDCTRLERLLDAVDRFNKMDESEKELIRLILSK